MAASSGFRTSADIHLTPSEVGNTTHQTGIQTVLIITFDGLIQFVTPDVISMTGYSPADVIGTQALNYFSPEHHRAIRKQWIYLLKKFLRGQYEPHETLQLHSSILTRSGNSLPIQYRLNLLPNSKAFLVIVESERSLQAKRLTAIVEIMTAVSRLSLDDVLELVHQKLSGLMDTRTFFIGIYDRAINTLHLKLVFDRGERLPDTHITIDPTSGLLGWIIREEKMLYIGDRDRDSLPQQANVYGDDQFQPRCLVYMPMFVGNEMIGVISVQSYAPDSISPDDIAILEATAGVTAITIQNVRLLDQMMQRNVELETAYADLKSLNEARVEIINNITHDIRSPLAIIKGYVDMMKGEMLGGLTAEQKRALTVMLDKINVIERLVSDILEIKMIRPDTLELKPTDLHQLIRQTIHQAQITYQDKTLHFETTVAETPLLLNIDPDRINRVLDNLLVNAVKFSKPDGVIRIATEIQEKFVSIKVSDNGIGIPADKLPYIFESFFQVQTESKQQKTGVGLGLAIVRQIVEAHGGTIQVESVVGEGSAFSFILPLPERHLPVGI